MNPLIYKLHFPLIPTTKDCFIRDDGDYLIVSPHSTGRIVFLNSTGKFIFFLCDGSHTIKTITEKLSEEFPGTDIDTIAFDVLRTIRDLENYHIVQF